MGGYGGLVMVELQSWGRLDKSPHYLLPLSDDQRLASEISGSAPGIVHGMGRSYGDVCLNPGGVAWSCRQLDHFVGFDRDTGVIEVESGVLLGDIQRLALAAGWMLPVTPGTQWVTVGGAVANDVHGKNHHSQGCFGNHLVRLCLVRTDGHQIDCTPRDDGGWFAATVGGMGLTGVITRATLQLRRVSGPWIDTETLPFQGLEEFFALSDDSSDGWEYTVSWIDCLSGKRPRGIFFRGRHAEVQTTPAPRERSAGLPLTPPVSLVNRWSLRALNAAYFHRHRLGAGVSRSHYLPFFYPLDSIRNWNRMYGPKGFYQYQCVIPQACRSEGAIALLDIINRSRSGSFLSVLKTFGSGQSPGMMSFPGEGVTLALDFPNRGKETLSLMDRLDAVVGECGGRIYPAKDARMPRDLFESGYPGLARFREFIDPGMRSGLSRRLIED